MTATRSRRSSGVWVVAALVVILAAGCASDDGATASTLTSDTRAGSAGSNGSEDPAPDGTGDAGELTGTTWRLVRITGVDRDDDATGAAVPAVVSFGDGSLDVYDGVNTATGTVQVDDDTVEVTMDDPSAIPYPAPDRPQYDLIDLLGDATSARVTSDGRLSVESAGGEVLVFEPAGGSSGG